MAVATRKNQERIMANEKRILQNQRRLLRILDNEQKIIRNQQAILKNQKKILLNLVFNALKFTPAGGRVELRAEKQGEKVLLKVADNGMGIAAAMAIVGEKFRTNEFFVPELLIAQRAMKGGFQNAYNAAPASAPVAASRK